MLGLKIIFTVAHFAVFSMGVERPGWPGYEYEADIGGWLKVHLEPADFSTARATCHSEEALLGSPWSAAFTSTITRIQASKSIPAMHSGSGLKSSKSDPRADTVIDLGDGILGEIIDDKGHILPNGQNTSLPYVCYAPAPSCGKGYDYRSETGSCYKLHKDPQIITVAISTCLLEGGYLAKLDGGDTERQLLGKMTYDADEFTSYIANDDGGPHYRHIFNSNSTDDYMCNEKHPFICEKAATNPGADLRD